MEQAVMQKWQYHIEEMASVHAMRESLLHLGEEGWELVSVTGGSGGDMPGPVKTLRARKGESYCLFFKRPCC